MFRVLGLGLGQKLGQYYIHGFSEQLKPRRIASEIFWPLSDGDCLFNIDSNFETRAFTFTMLDGWSAVISGTFESFSAFLAPIWSTTTLSLNWSRNKHFSIIYKYDLELEKNSPCI